MDVNSLVPIMKNFIISLLPRVLSTVRMSYSIIPIRDPKGNVRNAHFFHLNPTPEESENIKQCSELSLNYNTHFSRPRGCIENNVSASLKEKRSTMRNIMGNNNRISKRNGKGISRRNSRRNSKRNSKRNNYRNNPQDLNNEMSDQQYGNFSNAFT
jgi:hypothetical protein